MTKPNGPNGHAVLWFLFTTSFALVGTLALAWGHDIANRVYTLEKQQASVERTLGEINGKLDVLLRRP